MARTWPNNAANYLSQSAASSRLNFAENQEPFTISGWFKFVAAGAVDQALISKYSGTIGPLFRAFATSGKVSFFAIQTNLAGVEAIGATTLSTGTWYHVAAVYDKVGLQLRVYVNGVLDGTATMALAMHTSAGAGWQIGRREAGTNPMNGDAGEIAMWNQVLSVAELAALAQGDSPIRVRPANLKGYWPIFGQATPEPELTDGTVNFTVNGTLALANHAPVGPQIPGAVVLGASPVGGASGPAPIVASGTSTMTFTQSVYSYGLGTQGSTTFALTQTGAQGPVAEGTTTLALATSGAAWVGYQLEDTITVKTDDLRTVTSFELTPSINWMIADGAGALAPKENVPKSSDDNLGPEDTLSAFGATLVEADGVHAGWYT